MSGGNMIQFALSQDQIAIVERLVASGRFEEPHSVIGAALALLEVRERERFDCLAALHDALALNGAAADESGESIAVELAQDAPAFECADPFDADALDEIERLIATRAVNLAVVPA